MFRKLITLLIFLMFIMQATGASCLFSKVLAEKHALRPPSYCIQENYVFEDELDLSQIPEMDPLDPLDFRRKESVRIVTSYDENSLFRGMRVSFQALSKITVEGMDPKKCWGHEIGMHVLASEAIDYAIMPKGGPERFLDEDFCIAVFVIEKSQIKINSELQSGEINTKEQIPPEAISKVLVFNKSTKRFEEFQVNMLVENRIYKGTIPLEWTLAPDKIIYDEGTNPSRSELETQFAAAVVILMPDGGVIFAKRNPERGGQWSLPSTFISEEDDPNLLNKLRESVEKSIGIKLIDIELIGKRMGLRQNPDGTKWQLLMHLVFAKAYSGIPHLAKQVAEKTNMPKYTDLVKSDPEEFLIGRTGHFELRSSGDCTRCFGTVLHGGDWEIFKRAYYANNRSSKIDLASEVQVAEMILSAS